MAVSSIPAEWDRLDERFAGVNGDERVERLWDDGRWTEGPVWHGAMRCLLWSDIPNDRMMRWDEETGAVGVFRRPAGYTNGHTLDREGRLVSCEQGARRVTRTEADGGVTVLADRYDGRRLNSPNDVVVAADGGVWFTDPPYGILSDYEGHRAEQEIEGCHVYRIDPATGECAVVADDFERPNGLAFSLDERRLYVSDTPRKHIRVFDVVDGRTLRGGDVLTTCRSGVFDGFRLDREGRIWAASGEGVQCYDPDGTLLGVLRLPEIVSNCVFGGPKGNRLFVTASTSVYSILLNVTGAPIACQRALGRA